MVPSQGSFVAMEFLTHSLLLFSCILIAQIGNIHLSSCLLYLSFASCPRLPFFLSAMSKRCFSLILISIISIPSQCFRQSNFILHRLCCYFYTIVNNTNRDSQQFWIQIVLTLLPLHGKFVGGHLPLTRLCGIQSNPSWELIAGYTKPLIDYRECTSF